MNCSFNPLTTNHIKFMSAQPAQAPQQERIDYTIVEKNKFPAKTGRTVDYMSFMQPSTSQTAVVPKIFPAHELHLGLLIPNITSDIGNPIVVYNDRTLPAKSKSEVIEPEKLDAIIEASKKRRKKEYPIQYLKAIDPTIDATVMETKNLDEVIKEAYTSIGKAIETNNAEEIFNYVGITTRKDLNGQLILSHYSQPKGYTLSDIGVDENILFKEVSKIEGDADFKRSNLTSLGTLKSIGGNADFRFTDVEDLGELRKIGGNANFQYSKVKTLNKLKRINGNAKIGYSAIESLGNLEVIKGNADLFYSNICSTGALKKIGGDADFGCTFMASLGELEYIGGNASFNRTKLEDLGYLRKVGGNFTMSKTKIDSLGFLDTVGGNVRLEEVKMHNLGDLRKIGGDLSFINSDVKHAHCLSTVKGKISSVDSCIPELSLEKLKESSLFKINFLKFFKRILK